VINGERQTIAFESTPSGATVTILPANVTLKTPSEAALLRKKVHTVRVAYDGYCEATLFLDRVSSKVTMGNLVLGGLIGMSVDTDNGSAFVLDPDTIAVTLQPIADGDATSCGIPVCR
jgi:hypothetical protein